ncbi:MAG: pyridoxamine 5'-phosphate oxidase family protein [Marine Group I thaumarchaeote]|nr:MAG: pyridoxamine 5'-phosphate oxidase family protein [Marine Group I thaumarchaeote]
MAKISDEIKHFLERQKLGFVATISPDNTPNVSPKGTILAWDDEHLIFADIRSPQTISNLENNPSVEINVVDHILRKGYRFKGKGMILKDNEEFSKILKFYKEKGIKSKINAVVMVKVDTLSEVTSPLYDLGFSEEEIKEKWKKHYLSF